MNKEEFKKKFDDVMENTFIFGLEGIVEVLYDGGYILANNYIFKDNYVLLYVRIIPFYGLYTVISPTGVISLNSVVDIVTYEGTPEETVKLVRFDER